MLKLAMRMKDKLVKVAHRKRRLVWPHVLPLVECKALGDHRIVDKVLRSLQTTGRTRINFKTDGERAIVQCKSELSVSASKTPSR